MAQKRLWNEGLGVSFGNAKVSAGEGERCWTEGCGGLTAWEPRVWCLLTIWVDIFFALLRDRVTSMKSVVTAVT